MPIVYLGPVNLWSTVRAAYPGVDSPPDRTISKGRRTVMALGYDGKLYILAFDHRGSFQKKMFGIQGDPTDE